MRCGIDCNRCWPIKYCLERALAGSLSESERKRKRGGLCLTWPVRLCLSYSAAECKVCWHLSDDARTTAALPLFTIHHRNLRWHLVRRFENYWFGYLKNS